MGLTNKQRLFVENYLQCWNATEAARRADYSEKTAYSQGQRLLKNVEVVAEIEGRVAVESMSANEALMRLAEQARAAYADYINEDGTVDLAALKRDGKMHLVKGVKYVRGRMVVEFQDAQAALFKLAQVHGLQVERIEATVEIDDARERITSRIDSLAARLRAGGDSGRVSPDASGS